MPLWPPYDALLDSNIADVNNIPGGPFAGSVTAALFLRRFVEAAGAHVHLDIFGWTPSARPGRPEGAEVMGARALFAYLQSTLRLNPTDSLALNLSWGKDASGRRRRSAMAVEMRPAQALKLWHDVTLDLVKDSQPDLSSRQLAILLTVYLEAPPHTVRGLAHKLGVTKPVITRASTRWPS